MKQKLIKNMEIIVADLSRTLRCPHCGGKVIDSLEETTCLTCGKTNYLPLKTLDKIPRPKYKEESLISADKNVFKVKYTVMNRALLSRVPDSGARTPQAYASCISISGPMAALRSVVVIDNLKKTFYRATGIKLHDLEILLQSKSGNSESHHNQ